MKMILETDKMCIFWLHTYFGLEKIWRQLYQLAL